MYYKERSNINLKQHADVAKQQQAVYKYDEWSVNLAFGYRGFSLARQGKEKDDPEGAEHVMAAL